MIAIQIHITNDINAPFHLNTLYIYLHSKRIAYRESLLCLLLAQRGLLSSDSYLVSSLNFCLCVVRISCIMWDENGHVMQINWNLLFLVVLANSHLKPKSFDFHVGLFVIRYDGIDSIYVFRDQNKMIKQKIRNQIARINILKSESNIKKIKIEFRSA